MANTSLPVVARILVSTCGSRIVENTPRACQVSFWLLRTCPFIILIIGTIGNGLNMIILSRGQMKKLPITVYLLCLALADSVMIWNGLVRSTLVHGWAKDIRTMSVFTCATQEFVLHCSALFSFWVRVAISVERMLLIKFPIAARAKITRRNALIVSIILLIISILLAVHLPFGRTLQNITLKSKNNETQDKTVSACTFVSAEYLHFYLIEWSFSRMIYMNIVPVVVLICSTIVTIWTLFVQKQRVQPLDNNRSTVLRNERNKALTRISILIAVSTLVIGTPFHYFIYVISGFPNDTADEEIPNLFLAYLILYYMAMTTFAYNFFLYFGSGPMFKRELRKIWLTVVAGFRRMCGLKVEETEAERTATTYDTGVSAIAGSESHTALTL